MSRKLTKSNAHFKRAVERLPLGVASNFRYWGDERTIYVKRGRGARTWMTTTTSITAWVTGPESWDMRIRASMLRLAPVWKSAGCSRSRRSAN